MNNLSLLIKPASYRCNLDCSYCFYKRVADIYEQSSPFMDRGTLETMIRTVMQSDARHVSFCWQGGEPTLLGVDFFRDAVEIQQRYVRSGQTVENSLQTNGIVLDEKWLRFLSENHFLVGISLDGPADMHDAYRVDGNGRGTFDRVQQAIDGMRNYGVDFNVLTLLHDRNVTEPDRIYTFLRRSNFDYLQFIPCFEVDNTSGEILPFSIGGRELGDFYCRLFDRWYADGFPYVSIRLFEDILMYLVDGNPASCCWMDACTSYIVVEYNGDCYPCDFFVYPEWYLGNITRDEIPSILNGSRRDTFSAMKADVSPLCRGCQWFRFCRGDCTRFRLDGNGTYTNVSHYCQAWRMLFEHIEPVKAEITTRARNLRNAVVNGQFGRTGRNQPCPCGSGKKFKKCCGRGTMVM